VERGPNLGATGRTGMTERVRAALPGGGGQTGEPCQTFSGQKEMSGEPMPSSIKGRWRQTGLGELGSSLK